MLAYLCVINNRADDLRLLRIINNPPAASARRPSRWLPGRPKRRACPFIPSSPIPIAIRASRKRRRS
ncbi:MAG: hypothetical protein V8T00_00380 [Oscillospiraceae bacterium]